MTITVNGRKIAIIAIAALALLAAYLVGSGRPSVAAAATSSTASTGVTASSSQSGVTVTGSGKVTGTPDTLHISLTITATASSIDEALASANRTAKAVQSSLSDRGVDDKDMQTSGMSIQPNYTQKGAPSGYRVDESLTASLRDLSKAGAILGAAVDAGGDAVRVDGVNVALDDTSALVAGARTNAIEAAKTKATQYAEAAGRSLGEVISISEVVQSPSPLYYSSQLAGAVARDSSVPIQAGSADVVVEVTVIYAFA